MTSLLVKMSLLGVARDKATQVRTLFDPSKQLYDIQFTSRITGQRTVRRDPDTKENTEAYLIRLKSVEHINSAYLVEVVSYGG